MRIFGLITLIFATVGCGALERPSTVRPPSHPLLLSSSWLHESAETTPAQLPPSSRAPLIDQQVRRIGQNLDRIDRRRYVQVEEATNFLRAAYAGTRPRRLMGRFRSIDAVKTGGRSVSSEFQTGDILIFKKVDTVPPLAIVRRVHAGGRIDALGPWRGELRPIRVHLQKRSTRRYKGRIVNSFVRQKRPGDDPSTGYLAGELIVDVRRYLNH